MTDEPAFDPQLFKAATGRQWQEAAQGWNDHGPMIRAWLKDATQAMLDMAGIAPSQRVLDVAAGAGDQTLDIAARVGPHGHVLATDLSPAILAFARRNAERAGYRNVETLVGDGETLDDAASIGPQTFDAVVCRLGLMFFPDPLAGLRAFHRALKPAGRICTMVFGAPQNNPCIAILVSTALKHAGLPPRDPYQPGGLLSLGKPGLIEGLFAQAGFAEVATTKMSAPFRLASVADYLGFVRASASPIQQILGGLDDDAKQAAWNEIKQKLKAFDTATGWEGPNELLLTAARRI
ncbi:class I SAM-dependent methyltransferase [Roseiarcaceae bacterium H3SJ34-1]|uniref:class I SAM-dependent methyltransferase n=1 Tax=Terripilifer ovatus TaxID=3032367 RepID=UPI003AB966AF|nr:class I SAM-dependent methyltransferase [Roseiarcaceae bacterium H3SJ34-1]